MSSIRITKVANQIRDELAVLLPAEIAESRQALVTITGVSLSPDMSYAHVHVSIFPETAPREDILASINRSRGRLKGLLGRTLRLRRVPHLDFRLDTSAERGDRIERMIREAISPQRAPDPEDGGEAS